MKSLQARLSIGLLSVLLLGGLIFAQAGLWLFESGVKRYLETSLRSQSETLLLALARTPRGIELLPDRTLPAYDRAFSGYYFQIDLPDRHLRSRSLWDAELPALAHPGRAEVQATDLDGQEVILLRADYRRLGSAISITVAQDYTPIHQSFARLRQWGLAFGALLLLAVLALQRLIVTRALRPLEAARVQLAQLQQGKREQLQLAVPLELEPLITQINHLQAHTEDSLKKARMALGNLGHALKTPLAVLFSQVKSPRLDGNPALRAALLEQLNQIHGRLEKELARARLAGDAITRTPFDCAHEVPNLLATLSSLHGTHLELKAHCPPGVVLPWDREDMLELLGNLLDNACKWADSQVCLNISISSTGYQIAVEDDGPGIPEQARQQVITRGERLDEQIQGHGLGLGIVRDIIEGCHGTMALADSPLGGLRVSVCLPQR